MTPQEQAAFEQLRALGFNVQPIQSGDQILVLIQIATNVGVMNQLVLTIDAARMLSKTIKDGVEKAEVTLVKPQSAIATA